MVSILGDYHYTFPKKKKLELRLKDMLEDKVDEKYYLSDSMIKYILSEDDKYIVNKNNIQFNREIACSKTTREGTNRADASDYIIDGTNEEYDLARIERERVIPIKNNNSKGYELAKSGDGIDISSRMEYHRGTVQKGMSQTIQTECNVGVIDE